MRKPTLCEFVRFWLGEGLRWRRGDVGERVAALRRDIVGKRGWLSPTDFEASLSLARFLPGLETQQLAVGLGWRISGWRGGAAAGTLALFPALCLMLAFSWLAVAFGGTVAGSGVVRGLAGAAAAFGLAGLLRLGRASLRGPILWAFALAGFIMSAIMKLKMPGIVVGAGIMGLWLGSVRPEVFCPGVGRVEAARSGPSGWRRSAVAAAVVAGVWLAVRFAFAVAVGPGSVFLRNFSLDLGTGFAVFGGPYPALAHLTDMAGRFGWPGVAAAPLGIGLAAVTPGGPLLAAVFLGFLAAWRQPCGLVPLAAGGLSGLLCGLGLLLPGCVLAVTAAPFAARLTGNVWLRSALTGINAALTGVLLYFAFLLAKAAFIPAGGSGADGLALCVAAFVALALWRGRIGAPFLAVLAGAAGAAWGVLG